MTQEERNVEALRKGYALWDGEKGNAASAARWLDLFADEIDFRSAATGVPYTGTRKTKAALQAYFTILAAELRMERYTVQHMVAQGDRVVALCHIVYHHKETGRKLESLKADSWRFNAEGKAVEFAEHYDTAAAVAAAPSVEERNTEILRKAYGKWSASKGDDKAVMAAAAHWVSLFADTVEFGSMGAAIDELKFSRNASNKAEVAQYFADIAADWEMVDYVVKDYIAQGDKVVALCEVAWRHRRTGKIARSLKSDSWRFSADGQAIAFYEYFDTAATIAVATA